MFQHTNKLFFSFKLKIFFISLIFFSFQNVNNIKQIILGKISQNEAKNILREGISCYYYLTKSDIKTNKFIALDDGSIIMKINNRIEFFINEKYNELNKTQISKNKKYYIINLYINDSVQINNEIYGYGKLKIFDKNKNLLLKEISYYSICDE